MARLRISSWNINSIRLRLPLLTKLVSEANPDVIALQETKCPDELMPVQALHDLGYAHLQFNGMKGYNGVAILSRIPLDKGAVHNRFEKDDSRHVEARLILPDHPIVMHNLYIPAGGDIPDPDVNEKFRHKLGFVREMTEWFPKRHKKKEHVITLGDFNIAPFEHDVWSHKQLLDVVSHTPIEVEHLADMQSSLNWVDLARVKVPVTEKLYSWWSYRNRDWRKSNRGRRLDHIWATPSLAPAMQDVFMMTDARDWERPSDHVPVIADFDL